MRKGTRTAAAFLATALIGASPAGKAEEAGFADIAGDWYTMEIMMTVEEDGRFVLGWNDGDWTGSLREETQLSEEDGEVPAYRLVLDRPELSMWEELMLVPDPGSPGTLVYYQDDVPAMVFRDAPVSVTEVTEEELEYLEPYIFIDATAGREPAAYVLITFLRPVKDAAVLAMSDQQIDEDGELLYNGETLEWREQLDSQESIVVKTVFDGDLPNLAISFLSEDDGTGYDYALQMSGRDGSIVLLPLPQSQG